MRLEIGARLTHQARRGRIFGLFPLLGFAVLVLPGAAALAAERLLPAAQAYRLQAALLEPRVILLEYRIAPGYYLYRDRFAFAAENAVLGSPILPGGVAKSDPAFGTVQVIKGGADIQLPLAAPLVSAMTLKVTAQGCTERGLCLVPFTHTLRIAPDGSVTVSPP